MEPSLYDNLDIKLLKLVEWYFVKKFRTLFKNMIKVNDMIKKKSSLKRRIM